MAGQEWWTELRELGRRKQRSLLDACVAGDPSAPAWAAAAEAFAFSRLTSDRRVCDVAAVDSCGDPASCTQRCSQSYWLAHSRHVAAQMEAIATAIGMPPDLWSLVGFIHDADYVEAPHHVEAVGVATAHPFALLDELESLGAPASVQLAVLEHAAHTELAPSRPLSAALILADEHSTMTAYGYEPDYGSYASSPVAAALSPAPSSVSGYRRPDMAKRALAALRLLVAV